jgi:hypothetical protein
MTRTEGEAAAARAAKQMHVLAIKRGVMPMLMKREAALPPRLKLEGGSLPDAAADYVGIYMLDGTLVNGRPAWKHTNGRCWVAFDGADWRGQPEADLGQKRGALMLTGADVASPDASSATWQAWTGSAWAAQPALTCTVATAAELSAAQAALASAARAASLQALRSAAVSCLGCCVCTKNGYMRIDGPQPPEQVKNFRGPCAARCKPLAPCCCVSADGEAVFGCVPTDKGYFLPACLHMALCPQNGCDPMGRVFVERGPCDEGYFRDGVLCSQTTMGYFFQLFVQTLVVTPFVFCFQRGSNQGGPSCVW